MSRDPGGLGSMPRRLAQGYCRTLRVSSPCRYRAGGSCLGCRRHGELCGFFLRGRFFRRCGGLLFGSCCLTVLRSVIPRGVQGLFEGSRRRDRRFGRARCGRRIGWILLGQPQRKGDRSLSSSWVNGLGDLSGWNCSLRQRNGRGKRRSRFVWDSHSRRHRSGCCLRSGCRQRGLCFPFSRVPLVKAVLFVFVLVACVRKIFGEIAVFFFGGLTAGLGDITLRRSGYQWNRGGHWPEAMQDSCQSQVKEKTDGVESKTTTSCRLAIEN